MRTFQLPLRPTGMSKVPINMTSEVRKKSDNTVAVAVYVLYHSIGMRTRPCIPAGL